MSNDPSHGQLGKFVGAKIRAARLAKKYTQSKLALPDFSVSYISAIERGQIQPSLRALEILSRRLELSAAQIFPERFHSEEGSRPRGRDSANSEREHIALDLLEAHSCLLQGETEEAVTRLNALPQRKLLRNEQVEYRFLLSLAYLQSGQLEPCEELLQAALRQAEDQKDASSTQRAFYLLGLLHAAKGNYREAIQSLQHCLAFMEQSKLDDPFLTSQTYALIGQHYIQLEDFDHAIEAFKHALAMNLEYPTSGGLESMYQATCQHHLRAGHYQLAQSYALRCDYLHSREAHAILQSEIYHYLGRILLKDEQQAARAALEKALQQERARQNQRNVASLTTRMGEWFLANGDYLQAEASAQQAIALIETFGDTIVAVDALLTLGRIRYAQSTYDEGDRCFVQGLAMLERLGMHDELADQAALYAQQLEDRGCPQGALQYYKMAFQHRRA